MHVRSVLRYWRYLTTYHCVGKVHKKKSNYLYSNKEGQNLMIGPMLKVLPIRAMHLALSQG